MQASGCELDLIYHDPDRFEVILELGDIDTVPAEQKSLRASGKVSIRKMPVKRRAEIYQLWWAKAWLVSATMLRRNEKAQRFALLSTLLTGVSMLS
ncbi:hypothetical protein QEH52_19265 [Coraliomargarita sp. SDUM461003]|uniref:Uncharacterized protein n=1 Tax=Thalassobacterium maritimum TaxID=3041265 RepID=A0ABU1AZW8_9BACT|nr:hypothetical protein [Coraliomargarita sp. SDUM461003]MDQ8209667.1 hypothetical protein [Coraliomargarita sp. SDUM461003]